METKTKNLKPVFIAIGVILAIMLFSYFRSFCWTCSGHRSWTCKTCWGEGKVFERETCEDCDGKGEICPYGEACKGSEIRSSPRYVCGNCNGAGDSALWQLRNGGPCSACNGTGRGSKEIPGKVLKEGCDVCDGDGNCRTCHGNGYTTKTLTCKDCGGKRKIDCPDC